MASIAMNPGHLVPGHLFKQYQVFEKDVRVNNWGRPLHTSNSTESKRMISGIFSAATPQEIETYSQSGHPISHTIIQRGKRQANPGDFFRIDNRELTIERVHDPGELGIWTVYYLREQTDTRQPAEAP